MKVNDIPSINQSISKTFLADNTIFLNVKNYAGEISFYLPESARPNSKIDCKFLFNSTPIVYDERNIGLLEYCYDISQKLKINIPLYLYLILLCSIFILSVVLYSLFKFNTF